MSPPLSPQRPVRDGVAAKDRVQALLHEHYRALPREELERQGRAHLAGDTRQQAHRAVRLGRLVLWTLILGSLVLLGGFALWLLCIARSSGQTFAHVRQQALSAYTTDE